MGKIMDMHGFLHPNIYKEKHKQPDFTGPMVIHGVEYKVTGWKKQGKNGEYISFCVEDKLNQNNRNTLGTQFPPVKLRRERDIDFMSGDPWKGERQFTHEEEDGFQNPKG